MQWFAYCRCWALTSAAEFIGMMTLVYLNTAAEHLPFNTKMLDLAVKIIVAEFLPKTLYDNAESHPKKLR